MAWYYKKLARGSRQHVADSAADERGSTPIKQDQVIWFFNRR
jgi:hypothetical protein